jgi:lysophospholipase L1-like esterase
MLLKPGDTVVMQFGTNDADPVNDNRRARGTIGGTGEETQEIDNLITKQHEVVHTYGWYLRKYVSEIRAAGATPIICSPVPRKVWSDGRVVRSRYAGWARQVATEEHADFIDLSELIAQRYDTLGQEKVNALFADATTHTNRAGAEVNATIVAEALRPLLAKHSP